MTRILFVGRDPKTVDFADPALPPGFNAEKIQAGIDIAMAAMAARGWRADACMIAPDETAAPMLEKQLASAIYDCVVIGGGLRIPPKGLVLFETVVNAVHKGAPPRCHRLCATAAERGRAGAFRASPARASRAWPD